MATKKTKLFNLKEMMSTTKEDVVLYNIVLKEMQRLIFLHPCVNQKFIVGAVLDHYKLDMEWFSVYQEEHRQSIIDSVRGPK